MKNYMELCGVWQFFFNFHQNHMTAVSDIRHATHAHNWPKTFKISLAFRVTRSKMLNKSFRIPNVPASTDQMFINHKKIRNLIL